MPEPLTITEFRKQAGPLFSAVVQRHAPLLIRRGSSDLGVLLGSDEVWALLRERGFNPQIMRGDGSVSIWLPEFEIYGEGSTYAEAKAELLDEVRAYVSEYLDNADDYRRAPNRARHLPHVMKANLADVRGELESTIFPGPPAAAELVAARPSAN